MKLLFFDTETNGLPKNWKAAVTELDNWPRIIQMGWMLCNAGGEVINEQKHLVKPDGWVVPTDPFWVNNGYSTAKCETEGKLLAEVITAFLADYAQCDILVAHNMDFDRYVLGAEFIRYGFKTEKRHRICTKEAGTDLCRLPGGFRGQYKWPKLEELYRHLFNKDFDGAHDALADVRATRECFFEMVRIGHIKLPETVS